MVRKTSKKTVLPLLVIISAIIFTGLIGAITFSNIFPTTTPYVTSDSTVNLSYGIYAEDGLSSITHSWNGTNTTLYDSSLVLFYNFDNRSELGENDTFVRDLSMYGNNGTVVGGENITWGAGYGKYVGAFNFSGNKNYISTAMTPISYTKNFTVSLWVKFNALTANSVVFASSTSTSDRFTIGLGSSPLTLRTAIWYNGTIPNTKRSPTSTTPFNVNEWHHVVVEYNNISGALNYYIDSINQTGVASSAASSLTSGTNIGATTLPGEYLNASVDDVMIWNKSLSASEVNSLFNLQITKYNESYFQYNTTVNNSANLISNFICSKNATAVEFCTSSQTIRELETIKSNFSTSKGIIRDDFYGVNTHGRYFGTSTYIDTNSDGSLDTLSDYSWHRQTILNSNINFIRFEIQLDDYYSNTSATSGVNFTGNLTNITSMMKWGKDNGIKYLIVIQKMPEHLQNRTSGYCNSSKWDTCTPNDYTKYANVVVDLVNRTLIDSGIAELYLEVLNEPYLNNEWCNNLSSYSVISANEYIPLYNKTYDFVKANFTNVLVGGGNVHYLSNVFTNIFLSNMTNKIDFVSLHQYSLPNNFMGDNINSILTSLLSNCTTYSANCSRIIFSEFGVSNQQQQVNDSVLLGLQFSDGYMEALNIYPNNISFQIYQWADSFKYYSGLTQYPSKWHIVSEPLLDNKLYAPYNVTKNFAHLCPAGATVSVTSNDDDTIKQVSCKKGNMYSLIVINTDTEAKNITVNMTNNTNSKIFPYTSIMNYETGASIPVSTNGIAQLGVLDSYEILYLTSGDEDGGTLVNLFKFNEATGTKVYDLLQNASDGTISGSTWVNDGLYRVLSSSTYTIDLVTGLLTLDINDLYEYLFVDYNYNKLFGFHVSILSVLAGFLMIIVLGVGIIYVVKYFRNIKELE